MRSSAAYLLDSIGDEVEVLGQIAKRLWMADERLEAASDRRGYGIPRSPPGGTAQLGSSNVARIGFGVMQLELRAPSRKAALAILAPAVDSGIDHIDTAPFYGDRNELINEALGSRRDHIVLATKAAPRAPSRRSRGGAEAR